MDDYEALIQRGRESLSSASEVITQLPDAIVNKVLAGGGIDQLLNAILDRSSINQFSTVLDFLLAKIRHVVQQNYSFKAQGAQGEQLFISARFC